MCSDAKFHVQMGVLGFFMMLVWKCVSMNTDQQGRNRSSTIELRLTKTAKTYFSSLELFRSEKYFSRVGAVNEVVQELGLGLR